MSSLELFPISQLIHLKLQRTVAKPAEHSDDKKDDSFLSFFGAGPVRKNCEPFVFRVVVPRYRRTVLVLAAVQVTCR